MKNLWFAIVSLALVSAAPGCLPTSNLQQFDTNPGTSTGDSSLGVDSSTPSDNAQAPCTSYGVANPTRAICVSCYQSILSGSCPGKKLFSSCVDTNIRNNYISYVNQCISKSIVAGFTCNKTCSAGQVVDPTSCTCVAPMASLNGGIKFIDVGQKDFGPPIVDPIWPSDPVESAVTPNSCTGTFDLKMGVMNRGDTVFRLNNYKMAKLTTSDNKETVPKKYITSVDQPTPLDMEAMAANPGANLVSKISYRTGAGSEMLGGSSQLHTISTVSGASSDATTSDGDGAAAKDATWMAPGFGARDKDGNVYFSDTNAHVVRVICYIPGGPFCAGVTAGFIKTIAGTAGVPGYEVDGAGGTMATSGHLNAPHGIAVDSSHNVYIADSGNHIVRVICGSTASGFCSNSGNNPVDGVTGFNSSHMYTLVGTGKTPGFSLAVAVPGNLNYPYGIDVATTGVFIVIYIADYQNHAIRRFNGINLLTLLGNGDDGYQPNGAATTAARWMRYPTDVKINWNGNLVYSDSRNHLVRAICYTVGNHDFCYGAAVNDVLTLAGTMLQTGMVSYTPSPGAGEGIDGTKAKITLPNQLLLAKQTGDDLVGGTPSPNANFRDNNILFTERLYSSVAGTGFVTPSEVDKLKAISAMTMGTFHTCAEVNTGMLKCMGDNTYFQLGNDGNGQSTPQTVSGTGGAGRGSVLGGGTNHTCSADTTNGNLVCWGANDSGQLGNGVTGTNSATPAAVVGQPANAVWSHIAGGDSHTCASMGNIVYCWGSNGHFQLGPVDNNSLENSITAAGSMNTGGGTSIISLASGSNHTCLSVNNNTQFCWGAGASGQLGNGVASDNSWAISVIPGNPSLLAAGGDHTCALDTAGSTIYCWGSNSRGEIGIGTIDGPVTTPQQVQIAFGQGPTHIALGLRHSCVHFSTTNKIQCWGDNTYGQLGNDDVPYSTVPMDVLDLPTGGIIENIYAGGNHTCATISSSGKFYQVYCWGDNSNSQIGSPIPLQPKGNTLRILCGDNSTASLMPSAGLCSGINTPGLLRTLSGQGGTFSEHGQGDGHLPGGATFARLTGLTYDAYKNVIVSSQSHVNQKTPYVDSNLRLIQTTGGPAAASTIKYTITDSNQQSSAYCLRIKPLTTCDSSGNCSCWLDRPTGTPNTNLWEVIGLSKDCSP